MIGRFGVLTNQLVNFQNEMELPLFKRVRETGDYPGGYGFTQCHFFVPEELKKLFEKKTRVIEMAAVEGLASEHDDAVNKLYKNRKRWKIWIETHLKVCNQPSIIGASEHTLLVGIKK